jgi:hypothetical protein
MAFTFDLRNRTAVHENGFTLPIDLYDNDGDYTEEPKEAVSIGFVMPPDGIYVTIDMRNLADDEIITVLH